jgi:transposase-like protein
MENTMNEVSTDKQQYWLEHIEAAKSSGLSIAQYAKQHDIKAQKLYQWRSVIKNRSSTISTQETFTRVVTTTPLPGAKITLRLSGATLEFDSLPDPTWVSTLLSQIAARS